MTFRKKIHTSEIGLNNKQQQKTENSSGSSGCICDTDDVFSVLLQPRSLFIFSNECYTNYLHGISNQEELNTHNSSNNNNNKPTVDDNVVLQDDIVMDCIGNNNVPYINKHLCEVQIDDTSTSSTSSSSTTRVVRDGDMIKRSKRVSLTIRQALF